MPTLREMIERMIEIEKQSDDEPGAYPIWFKDDFTKIQFMLLLRVHKILHRVRNLFKRKGKL